nr:immunoglobulin light chain junction region [Macaca mulatta]MOW29306.1 immunoglobulin light chain junction region [Macaca mulatta]MOW29768.1 immunoglobulin light chain junction region [Macaca mulatta]
DFYCSSFAGFNTWIF